MHGVFIVRVYALGRGFFFLIKCICIVEFCLSFYFSYHLQFSTLKCRIMLNFVRFCRTCLLYTLLFPQLFPMYIAYIIIVSMYTIYFLKCIQYFFLYLLDKVHFICFANFISNTYIPTFVNSKHIKKYFLFFFLTYALKCAFLYTYFYPLVKH